MVLQPGQNNEIKDAPETAAHAAELGIENLQEGLEIIKSIGGMGAKMSMRTNELAQQVAEDDPDRLAAEAAIIDLAEAFLAWKEADTTIREPVQVMHDQKPSTIKKAARKERFKLIMPDGAVDTGFTNLFHAYKKLDNRLNGEYKAARDSEVV